MNNADEKKLQEIFNSLPPEVQAAGLKEDADRVNQNGKIMGILNEFKKNPIPVEDWIKQHPDLISKTARNRRAKEDHQ